MGFQKTIMNKYGTYDKGPKQNTKFAYLHCGVLNCEGFTTIIVLANIDETQFYLDCLMAIHL
jgi:hypothetical protein